MAWTHTIKSAVRSAANKSNIEVTVEWTDGVQTVVTKPMGNDLSPDNIKPILRNQQKALEEGDVALAAWPPVINTALDLTLTADEQAAADKRALEADYNAKAGKVVMLQKEEAAGIAVDPAELTKAIAAADAARAALKTAEDAIAAAVIP